ncbi:MAG TPA: glycosyltransferase, partial [Planctomycetota bacterium]|nr:glycosyltransferase [Planctomycetota bacterium]
PRLLALVDVVVVPSVWDDCAPLVVAEALAARAPVVGSRIGGIPDFVRDGENGLLFAPGDATDLARCLRAFADDPGLLGRLQRGIAPPPGFGGYVDAVRAVYAEVAARAAVAAGA